MHRFMMFNIGPNEKEREEIVAFLLSEGLKIISKKGAFKTIEFECDPKSPVLNTIKERYPDRSLLDDTENAKDWVEYLNSLPEG